MKRQLEVLFILILIFSTVLMMAWLFWPLLDADAMPCGPGKPGLATCRPITKPTATSQPVYVPPSPTLTPTATATVLRQHEASQSQDDEGQTFIGPTPQATATGDGRQYNDGIPTQVHRPPTATPPDPYPYPSGYP